MTLDNDQKLCYNHLKQLSEEGQGIGLAPPEFVTNTVERIESGDMDDGEWFALKYQLLGVVRSLREAAKSNGDS